MLFYSGHEYVTGGWGLSIAQPCKCQPCQDIAALLDLELKIVVDTTPFYTSSQSKKDPEPQDG